MKSAKHKLNKFVHQTEVSLVSMQQVLSYYEAMHYEYISVLFKGYGFHIR